MTNLNMLGNPNRKRKLVYDPNLADKVNKETEAEIRKAQLEAKLKKKKQPKESTIPSSSPIVIPQAPNFTGASFLEGDFGKTINERTQAKYGIYEAISKIQYDDNDKTVKGTNPFYVVAVNEILQEQFPQFRTASQAELEKILKSNALPLKGHYENSALVLRTKQDPNGYLAEDLFAQFKDKGVELKENSAYVLPLFTLKLRKDEQSQYKLSFDITDLTLENYFEAPILNKVSQRKFNSNDIDERIGLPKTVGNSGNRTLYTRNLGQYPIKNSGLCRLYLLVTDLDLDSGWVGLSDSDAVGRVVVVPSEAGTPKI